MSVRLLSLNPINVLHLQEQGNCILANNFKWTLSSQQFSSSITSRPNPFSYIRKPIFFDKIFRFSSISSLNRSHPMTVVLQFYVFAKTKINLVLKIYEGDNIHKKASLTNWTDRQTINNNIEKEQIYFITLFRNLYEIKGAKGVFKYLILEVLRLYYTYFFNIPKIKEFIWNIVLENAEIHLFKMEISYT